MMEDFDNQVVELLPRLRRYARSLSRNMSEAEDLVQDSLEAAVRGKQSWRGVNFKGWVMTIMTNVYRNGYRSELRPGMLVAIDDANDVSTDTPVSDPLERDRLWAAINALPPDYRSVLMLVVVEGYKYADVADMLDVPLGTVMSRLSRSRKLLTERLRANNTIPLRSRP